MHECPQCGFTCYCDFDDSNDCREDGICYHDCDPSDSDESWDEDEAAPAREVKT